MIDFDKLKNEIIDTYLDYLNNFLTVERFAAYYNVDVEFANKILELGRFYMSKEREIIKMKPYYGFDDVDTNKDLMNTKQKFNIYIVQTDDYVENMPWVKYFQVMHNDEIVKYNIKGNLNAIVEMNLYMKNKGLMSKEDCLKFFGENYED